MCNWLMQFVRRTSDMVGFQVLPKRWIVERTFAWLGKYRRLSKDYEYLPKSSEAFVYLASIHLIPSSISFLNSLLAGLGVWFTLEPEANRSESPPIRTGQQYLRD
jgi:hypothetical protein